MKAGSLCTGIGGLDLAAEAFFGCELAWYSEVEKAPCTVLEREWPGVPNVRDLTTVDWAEEAVAYVRHLEGEVERLRRVCLRRALRTWVDEVDEEDDHG